MLKYNRKDKQKRLLWERWMWYQEEGNKKDLKDRLRINSCYAKWKVKTWSSRKKDFGLLKDC